MEQNILGNNNEETLKMLWIDDSAHYMSDVCDGFIKKVKEMEKTGKAKSIEHAWWKLGDYYEITPGKRAAEDLRDCSSKHLIKAECFENNTQDAYVTDIIKTIKNAYTVVAIDLLLEKADIDRFNQEVKDPPLSARLYHRLTSGENTTKCILYTSYGLDGGLDEIWKKLYAREYKDLDIYDEVIYDRNGMAREKVTDYILKAIGGTA